jgi:hypothetical protein
LTGPTTENHRVTGQPENKVVIVAGGVTFRP